MYTEVPRGTQYSYSILYSIEKKGEGKNERPTTNRNQSYSQHAQTDHLL